MLHSKNLFRDGCYIALHGHCTGHRGHVVIEGQRGRWSEGWYSREGGRGAPGPGGVMRGKQGCSFVGTTPAHWEGSPGGHQMELGEARCLLSW